MMASEKLRALFFDEPTYSAYEWIQDEAPRKALVAVVEAVERAMQLRADGKEIGWADVRVTRTLVDLDRTLS